MMSAVHPIGPVPNLDKLGEWSLVLKSQEIQHGVSSRPDGYYFTVEDRDVRRTVEALRAYEEENEDFRPRARVRERLPFASSLAAPLIAAAVTFFFVITGPVALRSGWFAAGTADAQRLLHGEPWRAITALTLHADLAHVLGNALAGTVFLGFLFRRLGVGRGAFLVLVAGALANVANAAVHAALHQPHRSIGASTAVFAAVGVLAATQLTINHHAGVRRWTDRVGPVVGGVALLGMLGSSAHSDLWAHLLGLVVGALLGVAVLAPKRARTPLGRAGQLVLGTLSFALVVAAWVVAAMRTPAW
ncbi:MAG: rhomboid family intramembrane serine protease [Deltaproteobacteria bacterium]|nr:rhomboid family intramembrane serine protease [Deltaproteobacteria bacterium]